MKSHANTVTLKATSEFFGLFRISDPLVAWELAIGRVRSACNSPRDGGANLSVWHYKYFQRLADGKAVSAFVDEIRLEIVRRSHFPNQVSRLEGVFLFDSVETAQATQSEWPGFSERRLVKVNMRADRVTKVDSNWISNCLGREFDDHWMYQYWSGETYPYAPMPRFETIVSGIGYVTDPEVRKQCYGQSLLGHPGSSFFLASSCAGFIYGIEDVGQCRPKLFFSDDAIHGRIVLEIASLREMNFKEVSEYCTKIGANFPYDMGEELFKPDMSPHHFDLTETKAATWLLQLEKWVASPPCC